MNDSFEMKVGAAAAAGWWTLLMGAAFLTLQWIAFLMIMSARPAWLLVLWGDGLTWDGVRHVWLLTVAVFKLCLWVLALLAIWLTLWGRRLRRQQ